MGQFCLVFVTSGWLPFIQFTYMCFCNENWKLCEETVNWLERKGQSGYN